MESLSLVLVALYALLNAALAVGAGVVAPNAGPAVRLLSAALFLAAAVGLAWGAWHRETGWVLAGLVLASIAPVVYGLMVEHSFVLPHHGARAAAALVIGGLWWVTWGGR